MVYLTSIMADAFDMAWSLVKQQERTFVVDSVEYDNSYFDGDEELDGNKVGNPTFMSVTASELGIEEDYTQDEIEEMLVDWITEETGWLVQGYTWYEVTAQGEKKDWLNPSNDGEML